MPDAFESLRIGRNAMTPPADLAGRLLGRIREELGMTTTTTEVRDLYYATLTVPGDVARAARFFGELFGWQTRPAHVERDHTYVNVETYVAMGINDDVDAPHVWFNAPDMEQAMAAVERAGGRAELAENGEWADCVDDQGVRFGLSKPVHAEVVPLGAIPPGNIGYVTLNVPDEVRGRRFYGEVLGWRFDGGLSNPGFTTVPMGLAGGADPGHTIYVKVDDIEATVARVVELGGTAGEVDASPSGRTVVCADDQGTEFALWEPAPGY